MRLMMNEPRRLDYEMRVKEVMTRMPVTLAPDVSVHQAKELMRQYQVRHLPVLEGGELVGVISDRDIRTAETFHGPGYLMIGDAMSTEPYSVGPDQPLHEVLLNMLRRRIGSAVVQSPRGNVIGIFTTHDALAVLRELILLSARAPLSPAGKAQEPEFGNAA